MGGDRREGRGEGRWQFKSEVSNCRAHAQPSPPPNLQTKLYWNTDLGSSWSCFPVATANWVSVTKTVWPPKPMLQICHLVL